MEKIRAFIALEMPDKIRRELDELSLHLRQELTNAPLRWVPVDNMHLTLKFLGDISREQVSSITEILRDQSGGLHPAQISLLGLGAFPNIQRARVIWIGIDLPGGFNDFQNELEKKLSKIGFPPEERGFAPHLTVARVRGHARPADLARIHDVLKAATPPAVIPDIADRITLFSSQLKPSGSVYNALSQFVLKGKD